jgi:hypothetical protein
MTISSDNVGGKFGLWRFSASSFLVLVGKLHRHAVASSPVTFVLDSKVLAYIPSRERELEREGVQHQHYNSNAMSDDYTTTTTTAIDMSDTLISLCCSLGVLLVTSLGYKYIDPNGGKDVKLHVLYIATAIVLVALLPLTNIGKYVYTELTVALVGAMYPVYRSTRAVCTPDEDDDKVWLQYWVSS